MQICGKMVASKDNEGTKWSRQLLIAESRKECLEDRKICVILTSSESMSSRAPRSKIVYSAGFSSTIGDIGNHNQHDPFSD